MGQAYAKPAEHLRPQGVYPGAPVDLKRLKRRILEQRLAPCWPGAESNTHENEARPQCTLMKMQTPDPWMALLGSSVVDEKMCMLPMRVLPMALVSSAISSKTLKPKSWVQW